MTAVSYVVWHRGWAGKEEGLRQLQTLGTYIILLGCELCSTKQTLAMS